MHHALTDIPFETALYRGLGRAVLFLEGHDARPYRKTILDAVLYNRVYDPQINGSRREYLFDVIHATGEPEYYAERIRQAFRSGDEEYCFHHLQELAYLFAKNGDAAMRKAMYDALPERLDDGFADGISPLIRLDGVAAYGLIAERLMASEPDDEALTENNHYFPLSDLCEQFGEEGLPAAIEMARQANPRLTDYLNRVLIAREKWKKGLEERKKPETLDYETVKASITGTGRARRVWGNKAAKLDISIRRRLAEELLTETDPERLFRYLALFTKAPFPLDHNPLFALLHHENPRVAHWTYRVLANIQHPTIRSHGLTLLTEGDAYKRRYGLWLLTKNPGEGDLARVINALAGITDEEERHDLYMGARHYIEANLTPDAVPFLLEMYRETPCGCCRGGVVTLLETLNALPDWLCEEGIYDSESGIRESVSV